MRASIASRARAWSGASRGSTSSGVDPAAIASELPGSPMRVTAPDSSLRAGCAEVNTASLRLEDPALSVRTCRSAELGARSFIVGTETLGQVARLHGHIPRQADR